MAKPRRVAWDACTWIATIIQEKAETKGGGVEDRAALCNHVIGLASSKQVEIATSGLSLAEVCKDPQVKQEDGDVLADFFRNEYILIVPVDRYVGTLARQLMQDGHAGLRPPDAVHLATAVVADVAEFHTFDGALLKLDGKIRKPGGGTLTIRKPPAPPPSLFDGLKIA
ncbi:type II toxin-antitoxin system VapC family toxin [Sphingomonas sp. IC4-52]|uniref:type II toxin-antitoxin system VapC family toxin n=1 Tax=Sphingomonas sp. IC4-52 TaxID=2887202 RepID=UPI001D1257AA|nr:PIN domain-containing protein [Sphingomonas sp. IC4-52]MCC2981270.1 PIN domain-containing protein [Sphingomonas sp. IC4-52]